MYIYIYIWPTTPCKHDATAIQPRCRRRRLFRGYPGEVLLRVSSVYCVFVCCELCVLMLVEVLFEHVVWLVSDLFAEPIFPSRPRHLHLIVSGSRCPCTCPFICMCWLLVVSSLCLSLYAYVVYCSRVVPVCFVLVLVSIDHTIHIYICIYTYVYIYIYTYVHVIISYTCLCVYLSLSLYIYIYIYIGPCTCLGWPPPPSSG